MNLEGVITALATPFQGDQLDIEGLKANIARQLDAGISGLVVLGTTGEAATLTQEEKEAVVCAAIAEVDGRVPVIVGTGTNATQTTIEQTLWAERLGADAALVVTPYYNKPMQQGLIKHFQAVHDATTIPIYLYNVPSRTGCQLAPEAIGQLAKLPRIAGVKEASPDFSHIQQVIEELQDVECLVLSGDDGLTCATVAMGGHGVISVTSNLIPGEMVELVSAALQGDFQQARQSHYRLMPLVRALFIESNPICLKEAMNICGLPAGHCRLPLCGPAEETRSTLRHVLRNQHLIEGGS